jgi:GTPase SAR1 family protein
MGGCLGKEPGATTNEVIGRGMQRDKLDQSKEIKLLLLGAGESGKSIFVHS